MVDAVVGTNSTAAISASGGTGAVTLAVSNIQNAIAGLSVPSQRHQQPDHRRHTHGDGHGDLHRHGHRHRRRHDDGQLLHHGQSRRHP